MGPDPGPPGKLSFNILPRWKWLGKTSEHEPYIIPKHMLYICFEKKKPKNVIANIKIRKSKEPLLLS